MALENYRDTQLVGIGANKVNGPQLSTFVAISKTKQTSPQHACFHQWGMEVNFCVCCTICYLGVRRMYVWSNFVPSTFYSPFLRIKWQQTLFSFILISFLFHFTAMCGIGACVCCMQFEICTRHCEQF